MRNNKHIFITLLILGCASPGKQSRKLDDFSLQTLSGKPLDMTAFKNKTVFINVWATWCRPCIQEMPTIVKAMEKLQGQDVVFLFASSEELADIEEFRDRKKFPFEYVQLQNLEAISIEALPATFIFSPNGELVFGEEGLRDWSTPDNLSLIKQNQSTDDSN
jgi:thiol-disulfide isomerase/thioredoxin